MPQSGRLSARMVFVVVSALKHGVAAAGFKPSLFDAYAIRAQWTPAFTIVAPAIFAAVGVFPSLQSWAFGAGGTLLSGALPFAMAEYTRGRGKVLEPALWETWGGKPTVRMLRYRDRTIPEPTKARYFAAVAAIGIVRPTKSDEERDPDAADEIYDSAGDWLRKQARNPAQGSLVAVKNASYGFHRNALGVKWIGFWLALLVGLACLSWAAIQTAHSGNLPPFAAAAAVVNLASASLWFFSVNPNWVRLAADAYALALLETAEANIVAKTPNNRAKRVPACKVQKIASPLDIEPTQGD